MNRIALRKAIMAAWVIFIGEYDGSTSIHSLPRNPVDHEPFYA